MNTKVNLAGVELKNPVMVASGTFGSGAEYSEFVDLNRLGAVVTKGVASVPWPGNPAPRIAETASGMLNAIGLQNPGIDVFAKRDIPFLKKYDTKIVVNVCGKTTEDYIDVVERLGDEPVDMLDILQKNIWMWLSVLQMNREWICWRSIFPVRTSRKAVLLLGRIQRQWKPLQRLSRPRPNSRSS